MQWDWTQLSKMLGRTCRKQALAGAAADGRVVERNVAAATRLAASLQAIAAGLQHGTALRVATDALNANAVFGVLASAKTHRQIALANLDAIAGAATTAQAIAEHLAQVLQSSARDFVVAAAVDLKTAGTLLESHLAARQNAPIRRSGGPSGDAASLAEGSDGGGGTFQQHRSRHTRLLSLVHTREQLAREAG